MIYLHIGRGKAGSTSIQEFLANQRVTLSRHGVAVPEIRLVNDCANELIAAQRSGGAGDKPRSLGEIRRILDNNADKTILLSGEFLFELTDPASVEAFATATRKHDSQILIYLRDYPSLLVSLYNQSTKKGKNIDDIDRYFQTLITRISSLPAIRAWAQVYGADKLRIRSLDPTSLAGGTLLSDYAGAVGIGGLDGIDSSQSPLMNSSENWMAIELVRAVACRRKIRGPQLRGSQKIMKLLNSVASKENGGKAQYLTPQQWRELRDFYNRDAEIIAGEIPDSKIPPFVGIEPSARAFVPDFEALPETIKADLRNAVEKRHYRRGFAPELFQVLGTMPAAAKRGIFLDAHKSGHLLFEL